MKICKKKNTNIQLRMSRIADTGGLKEIKYANAQESTGPDNDFIVSLIDAAETPRARRRPSTLARTSITAEIKCEYYDVFYDRVLLTPSGLKYNSSFRDVFLIYLIFQVFIKYLHFSSRKH